MRRASKQTSAAAPSQRQLRIGEEIRHALASTFMREELHDPALKGVSLTFTEVRISPDLKNATVFFLPLGGRDVEPIVEGLGRAAPHVRTLLSRHVRLRALPRLRFLPDESFDHAESIDRLLRRIGPIDPEETEDADPDDADADR